jgi:hypothetical protein
VEDLEAESLQPRFTLTAANLREIANNEDFTPKSLDRNAIAKSKSRNKAGKTPPCVSSASLLQGTER